MQEKNSGRHYVDPIEKDDLTDVARNLENLQYVLCDIAQDYFSAYDTKTEGGCTSICYEFERYRHYVEIAYDLLFRAVKELHSKGIWCYEKEGA